VNTRPITDADIYGEVIHPWEDAHPAPGPDKDCLRAYFADRHRQDWPHPWRYFAGWFLASMAGATILGLIAFWLVTG
jgi:hypothetical protein